MDKKINQFISNYKKNNKKRFAIDDLEKYIIDSYKGRTIYLENGGYLELYNKINYLKDENKIKEIKSSIYNGLNPPLKNKWEIIFTENHSTWNKSKILQLSDSLDFTYYINNPLYQTDLEWEYIENIYKFLKSRSNREWASVEERSLELFYDEKWMKNRGNTPKGKYGILKRLKLSYEDLKMKDYGEMFIYWNRGIKDIKKVIILENHSTFFAYKRMAEDRGEIFNFKPDAIIFGEGKKIENSFSFIEEIANKNALEILYFGDIDPEGFGIYFRLKNRYPDFNIRLDHDSYAHLITLSDRNYIQQGQQKNHIYIDYFVEEMRHSINDEDIIKLKYVWNHDFRIPQELITYEYLLKVKI